MSFETTTSDAPTLAPAGYASLPAVVEISWTEWHGSNIDIAATLAAASLPIDRADTTTCAVCGSHEVHCIFLHYFHHIVESDVRVELACRACGKFTVRAYERL